MNALPATHQESSRRRHCRAQLRAPFQGSPLLVRADLDLQCISRGSSETPGYLARATPLCETQFPILASGTVPRMTLQEAHTVVRSLRFLSRAQRLGSLWRDRLYGR